MWTTATLTVSDREPDEVFEAVQGVLRADKRFEQVNWLEPGNCLVATTRFPLDQGGEALKVEVVSGSRAGHLSMEVTSASYPGFDWWTNRRNVISFIQELQSFGLTLQRQGMKSTRTKGGPPWVDQVPGPDNGPGAAAS